MGEHQKQYKNMMWVADPTNLFPPEFWHGLKTTTDTSKLSKFVNENTSDPAFTAEAESFLKSALNARGLNASKVRKYQHVPGRSNPLAYFHHDYESCVSGSEVTWGPNQFTWSDKQKEKLQCFNIWI